MASFWAVGQAPERERAQRVMGSVSAALLDDQGASRTQVNRHAPLIGQASDSLFRLLQLAQLSPHALRRMAYWCGGVSVVSAGAALLSNTAAFLLLVPASLAVSLWWLKAQAFRRAELFEKDYPALLLALASSVRTGLDPLVALQRAEDLFPEASVLGKELRGFNQRLEEGSTEEQAIRHFGATIEHPDIQLFRTAFLLAREEGSSLAACLHRLTRVTRNRQSFRRKVRAAVAMQKLSSLGIAGCAIVIVTIQGMMNVEALQAAAAHPLGARMLMGGATLMLIGLVVMLRMSRARI